MFDEQPHFADKEHEDDIDSDDKEYETEILSIKERMNSISIVGNRHWWKYQNKRIYKGTFVEVQRLKLPQILCRHPQEMKGSTQNANQKHWIEKLLNTFQTKIHNI